jgi:hypothetical protein
MRAATTNELLCHEFTLLRPFDQFPLLSLLFLCSIDGFHPLIVFGADTETIPLQNE